VNRSGEDKRFDNGEFFVAARLWRSFGEESRCASMSYRIEYSPDTIAHLQGLTARQRALVLDAVEQQLSQQPTVETRNRKPMRPNRLAPWEIRVEECRVY